MKDKLIIIATIQNVLMHMTQLMGEPSTSHSAEKMGALKGLSTVLLDIYYAITGNYWQDKPQELMKWMVTYCKDEADTLGNKKPTLTISSIM